MRYFHAIKGPLFDEDGNIYGTFGISRDITEQKNIDTLLHDNEQRFRAIVGALTEGVLVTDNKGVLIFCNAAAEKLLGTTTSTLRESYASADGRLGWRLIGEDMAPLGFDESAQLKALRTGQPQRNVVMGIESPGNRVKWLTVNSEPLFSKVDGSIESVVTSFAEITDVKHANQAMALQNAVLKLIATSPTFEEMIAQVAETFRKNYPEGKILITQASTNGDRVRLLTSAGLSAEAARLLREIPVEEGAGSCGTAAALKRPVTFDIASDPACVNFRELASQHGFNTWWSTPILDSDQQLLGTVGLLLKIHFKPEPREQNVIDTLTQTLVLAFTRYRIEEQSRKLALACRRPTSMPRRSR